MGELFQREVNSKSIDLEILAVDSAEGRSSGLSWTRFSPDIILPLVGGSIRSPGVWVKKVYLQDFF